MSDKGRGGASPAVQGDSSNHVVSVWLHMSMLGNGVMTTDSSQVSGKVFKRVSPSLPAVAKYEKNAAPCPTPCAVGDSANEGCTPVVVNQSRRPC